MDGIDDVSVGRARERPVSRQTKNSQSRRYANPPSREIHGRSFDRDDVEPSCRSDGVTMLARAIGKLQKKDRSTTFDHEK
jgi:hypothetical protein